MAFDFATVEISSAKQAVIGRLPSLPPREAGWASANPDEALALLFVAPADNGMLEEVLAA